MGDSALTDKALTSDPDLAQVVEDTEDITITTTTILTRSRSSSCA